MKPYIVRSGPGLYLGRILARSPEEALKTALRWWPGAQGIQVALAVREGHPTVGE